MNRAELQVLSRLREREAKALLDAAHYPGSYYLMGYSVECAIKAAIAKRVKRYDFPEKKSVQASYSHDLESLMQTAGLWTTFGQLRLRLGRCPIKGLGLFVRNADYAAPTHSETGH